MQFHKAIGAPRRWFLFKNADESGRDIFVNVEAIRAVVIDDPSVPSITVYAGLSTPVKKGQSSELKDAYVEVSGQEASEVLRWLDNSKMVTITASWAERPPPA